MTKPPKDKLGSRQLTLDFTGYRSSRRAAGSLRRKEAVKEALRRAVDGCGLEREEVAWELSRLVGEEVSIHTLNNYLARGRNNRRFPAEYLAALAVITGEAAVVEAALPDGWAFLDPDEARYYELGRIVVEDRERRRRKRRLLEELE